jgi:hypothetical protein
MTESHALVVCADCDLRESFDKLGPARACIERHRRETGHDPRWELGPLDDGVVRAGAAAGGCARCESEAED